MILQDVGVLLLGPEPPQDFIDQLTAAGFGATYEIGSVADIRDGLNRASGEGKKGIVTVNAQDGYAAGDVADIGRRLCEDPSKLYIGEPCEPPKKNWVQNVYKFLAGVDAASAQTSLFGMSAEMAASIAGMKSSEANFLMNIPLEARSNSVDIVEVPEMDVNAPAPTAHLLTRGFKLYYVFLKFSIAAMIAYLVDIGTFGLFEVVFGSLTDEFKILWSTILSRILCSIATYFLNRSAVFKSNARQGGSAVRFVILSVGQLILSWLLVWGIGSMLGGGDVTNMMLKVVVDFLIFMGSFTIMRDWVFDEKHKKEGSDGQRPSKKNEQRTETFSDRPFRSLRNRAGRLRGLLHLPPGGSGPGHCQYDGEH